MVEGNKPVEKFRDGPVSATIWENRVQNKYGELGTFYTISIERNYKDKEDKWKSTSSFRSQDMPKVRFVADKAYEFLVKNKNKGNDQTNVKEEEVH